MWWDWVKTSRDLEAMTWAEFHELFMSIYFPAIARYEARSHDRDRVCGQVYRVSSLC